MEINYEAMQTAYTDINKLIKDMLENINNIKRLVNALNNSDKWNGNAYKNYNEKINKLYKAAYDHLSELKKTSDTLYTTVANYKVTDETVVHAASSGAYHAGAGGSF